MNASELFIRRPTGVELTDTLPAGGSVGLDRYFASGGLPPRFVSETAPLLRHLDRARLPYDITTDLTLARGEETFGEEITHAVREYAMPLKDAGVDTVILGCTHYPLIRPIFQRVFGRGVTLVFSAEETAREVAETLERKDIENADGREGTYRFLTTGDPALFRTLGQRFLQLPIDGAEHVEIAALQAVA